MRKIVAPLAVALFLTACGTQRPLGLPQRVGVLKAKDEQGQALIKGLRDMAATLNTFAATASFWETDGKEVAWSTAEVFTAKPGKIRANLKTASNPLQARGQVLYLGDKKVTFKLGFVKKTLDYTDKAVTSLRGWRIDQTDLTALIAGVTDPAAQVTAVGPNTVAVTSPTLLPGVTREVVVLEPKTFVPLKLEAFVGETVVYRVEISKAQLNPALPPDTFIL